jgi:hypothetical protein
MSGLFELESAAAIRPGAYTVPFVFIAAARGSKRKSTPIASSPPRPAPLR